MGISLMIMIYLRFRKDRSLISKIPTLMEFVIAFKEALLPLMTPAILIGGISEGIFTPTEAGVVASVYALFLGVVVYKEISFADILNALKQTVETTSVVMFLVMTASVFGWILSREQVPQAAAQFLISNISEKWIMLLVINIFLLFVGCFIESLAALIILVPVFTPLIQGLEIHPIQFGVMMVLNLMIGTLTPPVGTVLFMVSKVSGLSYQDVTKGTLPFLIPLIIVLLLVTYIPEITLYIPQKIMGIE
jgi:tripartite ATP-independent transporter DctM subunit